MLEAVSAAREDRDTACLNFALNWLYHFSKTHPELSKELEDSNMLGTAKESLAYLRTKAKETGMWVLWSSALLSEAKLCLSNGESISNALENMARSSHVIIERNMKPMMGAQISLTTTLWDRLGLASMSAMMCEVFLRCHATSSLFDDQLRITCRLSGLLSSKGMYEEAFERLESLGSNSLRSDAPNSFFPLEAPDGTLVYTDLIENDPNGLTRNDAISKYMTWRNGAYPSIVNEKYFNGSEGQPDSIEAAKKLEPYFPEEVWAPFSFTLEENEFMSTTGADIQNYVEEMEAQFITGRTSFDQWDNYVSTLEKMGLAKYMEIYNAAYKRYQQNL